MEKYDITKIALDRGSLIVAIITFVLFVFALFVKGVTQDILLEAAVFLVSLKLIISSYRLRVTTKNIEEKIDENNELLRKLINTSNSGSDLDSDECDSSRD